MQQTIDDKGLRTILRENILNDRPITLIDDRNNYPTCQIILLLKGKPVLPPGVFKRIEQYLRRWKQIQ